MLSSDVTPQKRAPRGSKTGFGSGSGVKKSNGRNGAAGNMLNGNGKRGRNVNGGAAMDDAYASPQSLLPFHYLIST